MRGHRAPRGPWEPMAPPRQPSQTPPYYYFLQSKQPRRKEQVISALSPHLSLARSLSLSISQKVVCSQLAMTRLHPSCLFLWNIHFSIFTKCRIFFFFCCCCCCCLIWKQAWCCFVYLICGFHGKSFSALHLLAQSDPPRLSQQHNSADVRSN